MTDRPCICPKPIASGRLYAGREQCRICERLITPGMSPESYRRSERRRWLTAFRHGRSRAQGGLRVDDAPGDA